MNIPTAAEDSIAIGLGVAIISAAIYTVWNEVRDRYQEWRWRHVCPYCGSAVIVRNYGGDFRARVCLNELCGATWRVR
jgi:ribosomal protein L37AE/L43A